MLRGQQALEGAAEAPLTSRAISPCLKVSQLTTRFATPPRSRASASPEPAPVRSLAPGPQGRSAGL